MRVLFLTPGCFDKGGISRYSRYQISALRELLGEANVRVYSVLGPGPESFEDPFEVTWSAGGVSMARKATLALRVACGAIRWRPEVIHSAHVNMSGLTRSLAAVCGAQTILNVYGLEVWSGFRKDAAWGLEGMNHVISDSHFTARYLEEGGSRLRGSTAVVWDCVDADKFFPAPPRPEVLKKYGIPNPTTGFNLMTLGRLSRAAAHKGYERLLDVFKRVASDVPELRLVYAGRGDLVDVLRARASTAGLSDRVFFTGTIHDNDLPDVYRSAHLFSLVGDRGVGRGEGIPLTPLEAAACAVPILVGDQDGSREAVVPGVNGWALDPFDLDGLAGTVVNLAKDAKLRARMAAAARSRIEQEFTYPIFREKHRALLERWFDGRTRAPKPLED